MARTAASGSSSYASADDFLARHDERIVRQLLSDGNSPVTGSLTSNTNLLAALKGASGEVEAAACAGQRYIINSSQNDLDTLTGNSEQYLIDIVSWLAYYRIWSRRPNASPNDPVPMQCQRAEKALEALVMGERVFGILENHQAAALEANKETSTFVNRRNGSVTIARRYFGQRARDLQG